MGWRSEESWFVAQQGREILCPRTSGAISETRPSPLQWTLGIVSPEVKRLGRKADHSPQLLPRPRISGVIPPLAMPAGGTQEQVHLLVQTPITFFFVLLFLLFPHFNSENYEVAHMHKTHNTQNQYRSCSNFGCCGFCATSLQHHRSSNCVQVA